MATVETFEEDIQHFFSVIRNFDPEVDVPDGLIAREAKRLRLNTSPPQKVMKAIMFHHATPFDKNIFFFPKKGSDAKLLQSAVKTTKGWSGETLQLGF